MHPYFFQQDPNFPHYYGHIVRRLFLVAGIIILVTLATAKHVLPFGGFVSFLLILVVSFFAGMTGPFQKWVIILDTCIAFIALIIFEQHAVSGYENLLDPLFWINQLLAVIFFFAFYYATKTLRGFFFSHP